MKKKLLLFYTLCNSEKEAQKLAKLILKENIGVCVNLLKNIKSFYVQDNQIKSDDEIGLIIKSTLTEEIVINFINKNHKYKTPFIANIRTNNVNEEYLEWALKAKYENISQK